jgi:Kef-type K+ transport system membrane component KefB
MNFLLALVLAVALAKFLGEIMERIGLVSTLGEYAAGLILGVSLLGIMQPHDIETFAIMGVVLLMFLAGYEETDVRFLVEHEKKLVIIALVSLLLTIGALFMFGRYFLGLGGVQALFFGFIFGLTDVAVGAKTLLSTGKLETDTGRSLLAIGVIDTIIGVVLLAVAVALALATSPAALVETLAGIGGFFVLLFFMSKVLPKIVDKSVQLRTEEIDFSIALASIFLLAFIAEELGIAAVLGAYFTGVILQKSGDLRSKKFSKTMSSVAYGFFVAVFFVWMGLQVNLQLLSQYLWPAIGIMLFAIISKTVIVTLVSKSQKEKWRESIIYGIGMSAKGADNLIIVAIGASLGILVGIDALLITSMAITIIVSIIVSSIILKKLLK